MRFRRTRRTVPPRVLPLLPVCFVAYLVGQAALGVLGDLTALVSGGVSVAGALGFIAMNLAVLVAGSFVLRRLVARWVVRHPPRSP